MNITKEQIDELNAVVKVAITKEDYQERVDAILKDYRKKADVPGFRKGHVPIGLIKKQYGKAVLVDEVNKLIQDNLNDYLINEKLDVLGNPLPKQQDNLDWDGDAFDFEFELGLAPDFEISLQTDKPITHYKIVADPEMVDEQIARIQRQYGKLVQKQTSETGDELTGKFTHETEDIDHSSTLELDKVADKQAIAALTGKSVGDTTSLRTKELLKEHYLLASALGISAEKAKDLDVEVDFSITEINERQSAVLDQELFNKLFGPEEVRNEQELKDRIKADAEKQFAQQSEQRLLHDVTEYFIDNTVFSLPSKFLTRWIQTMGDEPLSSEAAAEEYEKSEKALRNQLIEGKIIKEHGLGIEIEELQAYAKDFVRGQMQQYGHMDPEEKTLEDIAGRVLSNQDEIKRLSEQLMSQKLLALYKDKVNLKVVEITYENFVKEVYG